MEGTVPLRTREPEPGSTTTGNAGDETASLSKAVRFRSMEKKGGKSGNTHDIHIREYQGRAN